MPASIDNRRSPGRVIPRGSYVSRPDRTSPRRASLRATGGQFVVVGNEHPHCRWSDPSLIGYCPAASIGDEEAANSGGGVPDTDPGRPLTLSGVVGTVEGMAAHTQLAPATRPARIRVTLPTGTGTWWQVDDIVFHTRWAAHGYLRTPPASRDSYLAALADDGYSYDIDPTAQKGL